MPLHVREAVPADVPAIAQVYAREVLQGVATYEYDPPDADDMLRRYHAVREQGYPYLAAEADGDFAGYAYVTGYRSRSAYRFTVENTVYVAAHHQGRGVGHALLQALIEACEARGYRQMIAVIGGTENQASVKLHQRCGFRTVGVFQGLGRKHGRWLDTVQMQRALGSGSATPPDDE